MPHSVALLAALSGLGATAAHTKAEAGLEACFLHASFADGGHAVANAAAVSPHICAAPALLKVAGKAASDFFTGFFSGVKTVGAGSSPPVCLSAGAPPAVSSSASVCAVGVPKALGTSITAVKASGSSHATTQLLGLKYHTSTEGAAAGGNRLISDSFAALRGESAKDFSHSVAAHTFSHTLPMHSAAPAAGAAAPAAPAVAAPAAAGAGAPTAAGALAPTAGGAVASVNGAAAKTAFACKGAVFSAQHKGMVLSKTAVHGGHHAWKTRSSFFGRSNKGGRRGAGNGRAQARAQKQAAKEAQKRQRQMERPQRKKQQQLARQQRKQQQLARQQRKQQQQMKREQRAQQRERNRAYQQQRAESREMYRMERDRLKQEQRQLRSLTRNELRIQKEQERLAAARARGAGGAPYYSSTGYGGRGAYGPYGGGSVYGAPGAGYGMGSADYYGGPGYYGGEYPGQYGGEVGAAGGYDHYAGGDEYGGVAYADHGLAPAGSMTQHVYAQPGGGEGLKSVTVVQDIAETKGGVTLHHVTETTSRARDVLAPQHGETTAAACCFVQLRGFTCAQIPQRTCGGPVREQGNGKTVAAQERGGGGGCAAAVAAAGSRADAAGRAGGAARLKQGFWVTAAPLQGEAGTVAAAGGGRRRTTAAVGKGAEETTRDWTGNRPTALHSIREEEEAEEAEEDDEEEERLEDEEEEGNDIEEGGGKEALRENVFLQITREACALFTYPFGPLEVVFQPFQRLSVSDTAKGLQLRQQQERRQQRQRPQQPLRSGQQRRPQEQGREERFSLRKSLVGSSGRLFSWTGEQRVHAPRRQTADAAAAGLGKELCSTDEEVIRNCMRKAGLWNSYEHVEEMKSGTRREGRRRCWVNASALFARRVKVTEIYDEQQYVITAEASENIRAASAKTAATASSTAAGGESCSQVLSLWTAKKIAGNSCIAAEMNLSGASPYNSRAAAQPTAAQENKDKTEASHFQKGGTLDEGGRRADHVAGQICCVEGPNTNRKSSGTDEGSMAGNDHVVEGKSRVKERSLTKTGGSRARTCSLEVQRPSASECVAVGHYGACAATAADYLVNVADVQATFVSAAAAAAHACLPAADTAFSRSVNGGSLKTLQLISGRRVQLSFLPFRKLMYSNFF